MNIVIFGLTITSAWGNGHATLWRGLCRALRARHHRVRFFERDVPYYAAQRDLPEPEGCDVTLYTDWDAVRADAGRAADDADVAIVTSYCPDGRAASALVLGSRATVKTFYDLDTPVTLSRLERGETVGYLPEGGLGGFDLVLSFTGGRAIEVLRQALGATRVAPLYGSVDPERHHPVAPDRRRRADLSYLGTYSADRQDALEQLFVEPARCRPDLRFTLAGSQYPRDFPWTPNMYYLSHMPPHDHPSFFCSSGLTLNVTRRPMAEMGYCPSGRLFEAAACGTAIVSDHWEGLEQFFEPGREIFTAAGTVDALAALDVAEAERMRVARAARERTLDCHTAAVRADELESILGGVASHREWGS